MTSSNPIFEIKDSKKENHPCIWFGPPNNPIQEDYANLPNGWYFWDETWSNCFGPLKSRMEAATYLIIDSLNKSE